MIVQFSTWLVIPVYSAINLKSYIQNLNALNSKQLQKQTSKNICDEPAAGKEIIYWNYSECDITQ